MYANQLQEKTIAFNNIFLDPNNPRFWDDRPSREYPDTKIMDEAVQQKARSAIDKFGVDELYLNMLQNGFLPLDRIVVRPIKDVADRYVVVEGNRRTRALQKLRKRIEDGIVDEDGIDEDYLSSLYDSTKSIKVLVYDGSDTHDISWILQGIRHISGIKDWGPAQQARLVADRVDNHGLSFTQAGQQFGISPQKVGRLYRTFKALRQMSQDDEFQTRADNRYFSLFEEAIRSKDVRNWLGWDQSTNQFMNGDNLHRFYDWISPDEEAPDTVDNNRRIHDPRQIKRLGYVIAQNEDGLLSKLDQWEITIDQAYDRASAMPNQYDWKEALEEAADIVSRIPQGAIQEDVTGYLEALDALAEVVTQSRKMASALTTERI
jgi:hypothetical protein